MNPIHWSVLIFVVNALAIYRIVRLVQRDGITKRLRQWIQSKHEFELLLCPWCLSPYVGIVTVWLSGFQFGFLLLTVLALSAIAGMLSSIPWDDL